VFYNRLAKFLALLLFLLFSNFQTSGAEESQTVDSHQLGQQRKGFDFIGIPVRVISMPSAVEDKQRSEASAKIEEENLNAQKSVAASTVAMVGLTKTQIFIAAIGTLGLLFSLILNWYATRAASLAATAAMNSNRLAREIAWTDRRPWLSISTPEITSVHLVGSGFFGGDDSYWFEYSVKISNSGKTPAMKVHVWHAMADIGDDRLAFEKEVEELERTQRSRDLTKNYGLAIAPGGTMEFRLNRTVDFKYGAAGEEVSLAITLHLIATYTDTDGEKLMASTARYFFSGKSAGATMYALTAGKVTKENIDVQPTAGEID